MVKTIHFIVTGRVQGVFFRASCKSIADRYSITGWVRNLPDGRVEGMATGAPDQLAAFRAWLDQGPGPAQVTGITVSEVECREYADFKIR